MANMHSERLKAYARKALREGLLPIRRQVRSAAALCFVVCAVLLVLNDLLPFPPPGERILYDPTDWSLLFSPRQPLPARPPALAGEGQGMGGLSSMQPPVELLLYKVRPGDSMGTIASKLGVSVDTLSSMNRVQGQGVHTVIVGELLKVPSQDGIPVALAGDFDAFCEKYKLVPDEVLSANSLTRSDLHEGMVLFLPRVQHKGAELALITGTLVAMPLRGYESSPFGRRSDPITGLPSRHTGVDIAAPMGSPIRSSTDGTVITARYDSMLGNYVEIRGFAGYSYVYGHMRVIRTSVGVHVNRGQLIGLVGDTGYATGPHLHFEVRRYGVPLNPSNFLYGIR